MKHLLITGSLAALMFASCNIGNEQVKGNGNIRSEERTVSSFDEVEVDGALDVYISQGDMKPVRIEGDENLIPYIEIVEEGDRIKLRTRNNVNLNFTEDIKVYITAPQYRSIDVGGASKITGQTAIDNNQNLSLKLSGASEVTIVVDAPEIQSDLSGSSTLNVKGKTKEFNLETSGASKARCFNLLSENTFAHVSGAGDAEVYASVKLDAQVSGAGNVKHKGNAKSIKQEVSGAGSVNKVD